MKRSGLFKRLAIIGAVSFGLLLLAAGVLFAVYHEARPQIEATSVNEADAFARKIAKAVNIEAWDNTGAVQWTFAGKHQHPLAERIEGGTHIGKPGFTAHGGHHQRRQHRSLRCERHVGAVGMPALIAFHEFEGLIIGVGQ